MDPLKKVTDDLALLGGELSIDRFFEARQAAAPAPQPKAARAAQPAQKQPRPAAEKASVAPAAEPADGSDTGKLRLEVEAFMNRDSAEDTDDREVQEFLKDRAGFDPSELE